jgi:hypothetical protein
MHILDLTLWMMGNPKPVTVSVITRNVLSRIHGNFSIWREGSMPADMVVEEMAAEDSTVAEYLVGRCLTASDPHQRVSDAIRLGLNILIQCSGRHVVYRRDWIALRDIGFPPADVP